jgi:simple sugar transport system permease protein
VSTAAGGPAGGPVHVLKDPAPSAHGGADRPDHVAPPPPRSWGAPIALLVFALLALGVFGLLAPAGETSTFGISTASDLVQVDPLALPSKAVGVVLGLLCLALAAYSVAQVARHRRPPAWLVLTFGTAFVLAFLVWTVAGAQISFTQLLQGTLALAAPLVFGSLSGILCERAGIVNIAIEGQMLAGAFLSAVVASLTDNLYLGLLAAPVAGLAVGALLAVFTIRYLVDQIIVGVVLNVLVLGLTTFLLKRVLEPDPATWNSPGRFAPVKVPLLGDIPVVGPVVFTQTVVVYLMFAAVLVVHVALFRTRWGLRVRAVGEHPKAADTVGIAVNAIRRNNVLLGGLVAGLGGAYFTLGAVGTFSREMTAGSGFIALAAMIFGRWSPFGAFAAALLFGFANNLQSVLGVIGTPIPSEFMLMAPYLATIFAVAGLVGRVRGPAAAGIPYVKT